MEQIWKQILELVASISLGAFGALVRIIAMDPKQVSLIQMGLSMITGSFVGAMTWIILSNVSTYSPLTICSWAGILGVCSKEVIITVVSKAKIEARQKYGVKFKK